MSLNVSFGGNRRALAYSVLAISVLAAVSSVGLAFAAPSSTTTTTASASMGSQSGAWSQSNSSGSTNPCPNMGSHGVDGPAGVNSSSG